MNRLMRKLENFAPVSEDDKRLLDDVIRAPHEVAARTTLVWEGDAPDHVHLILDGFACRYKVTSGGVRHIMAYLVPGDFCDLHVLILKVMDHNIGTLSACRVVKISAGRILEMTERPALPERSGGPLWSMRPCCASGWSTSGSARRPERLAHTVRIVAAPPSRRARG